MHVPPSEVDSLLALESEELVKAVSGSHRKMLLKQLNSFKSEELLRQCESYRTVAICRHRFSGYPAALEDLKASPTALFVNGQIDRLVALAQQPSVAIVGARKATAYGRSVAQKLGRELSTCGVTVVSGMAFGVDSAAHEGALEVEANTVAVLAGSSERSSPASKRALYKELVSQAAVISELPPGTAPRPWLFPARNRLIAALASLTVIVEAEQRSGALITATMAHTLNRDVAAIPGQITSSLSVGTNALIVDGALPIVNTQGVLDALFGVGARTVKSRTDPAILSSVSSEAEAVLTAVSKGLSTVEELSSTVANTSLLLTTLADLELQGAISKDLSGRYSYSL